MPRKPLIDADGEVRELTEEDFRLFRPIAEVDPGMVTAMAALREKRLRGRPKSPAPKRVKSFKLSPDVIDAVVASGPGYNARVEQALRRALEEGHI